MSEKITQSRIVADLRANLGLADGDRIAVHSSLKSLGLVEGGPATLIAALIEAVGGLDRGTVLMPCFVRPADVIDVLHTPTSLGLVPETFRTWPGVRLSRNHTHRVAVIGRDADAIAACHIGASPLGAGSPFHELAKRGGTVVHIGCNFCSSSLIHVAEHLYPLPFNAHQVTFPDYNRDITLICQDGSRVVCPPIDNPGDSNGFGVLQEHMERYGLILHGRVGHAECMRARGLDMIAMAIDLMHRDPAALLCHSPNCAVCPAKRAIAEEWRKLHPSGC
jgi:aminoglycoside 3-N-acetyltransferase